MHHPLLHQLPPLARLLPILHIRFVLLQPLPGRLSIPALTLIWLLMLLCVLDAPLHVFSLLLLSGFSADFALTEDLVDDFDENLEEVIQARIRASIQEAADLARDAHAHQIEAALLTLEVRALFEVRRLLLLPVFGRQALGLRPTFQACHHLRRDDRMRLVQVVARLARCADCDAEVGHGVQRGAMGSLTCGILVEDVVQKRLVGLKLPRLCRSHLQVMAAMFRPLAMRVQAFPAILAECLQEALGKILRGRLPEDLAELLQGTPVGVVIQRPGLPADLPHRPDVQPDRPDPAACYLGCHEDHVLPAAVVTQWQRPHAHDPVPAAILAPDTCVEPSSQAWGWFPGERAGAHKVLLIRGRAPGLRCRVGFLGRLLLRVGAAAPR
mmetsp:Transcript_135276/g.289250  ORF Transcript_135276/g.289250 Transcript_135276/m.289250 type:complete len:383 (+) Transcript_135276:305-1453(+)